MLFVQSGYGDGMTFDYVLTYRRDLALEVATALIARIDPLHPASSAAA